MPIHAPKILVFGGSEPLNVIGHHRAPKRHLLGRNRTYMPILVQIGRLVRPVRETKKSKKRKKGEERNLRWQTRCSHRPPTLTQRYVVLHAGWSSGDSSKFQVSSKLVEPFSKMMWGVEICHFLYLRRVAYITDKHLSVNLLVQTCLLELL